MSQNMRKRPSSGLLLTILFVFLAVPTLFAQGVDTGRTVSLGLFILVALVVIAAVMLVSDNLLGMQAKRSGVEVEEESSGLAALFAAKPPRYVDGTFHKFKKGYNINLKGKPSDEVADVYTSTVAIQPQNFVGMSPIPKMLVNEGDEVRAGDPLFFDKKRPEIKYVAPASGEVIKVNRGEKRSIVEVVILVDGEQKYRDVPEMNLEESSREDLVQFLLNTGGWTLLKQRPFDIVPVPNQVPANVFVSTFDTAPLAPNLDLAVAGREDDFKAGLALLAKLTDGSVHLGLDARGDVAPAGVFAEADAEKHYFAGPHPAGNVGVQMHHVAPVNSKDVAWIVGVQEVIALGTLLTQRRYDGTRVVALAGEGVQEAHHVRTLQGAKISELVKDKIAGENQRFISGDVLSGGQKDMEGYLDFHADQLTVIPEGNDHELFGWLLPFKARPSVSRTFPNFLFPDVELPATTNTHGEGRAFVVTGQYESMLPMDVYPQHLMKAIMARDFERMEGLGIYELSEEDIALCEFACTSKQPLQSILREGLDYMREQG